MQEAANAAYAEYEAHMAQIRVKGSEIIDEARRQGRRIIVLAGRPYHVDPEVNHGIDHLITRHGAAVVTEDSISNRVEKFPTSVLNQWTYHSRLYAAAEYVKRLQRLCRLEIVELPESRLPDEPSPAELRRALQAEAAAIRERLPKGGALVAMCIEGKPCSSEEQTSAYRARPRSRSSSAAASVWTRS